MTIDSDTTQPLTPPAPPDPPAPPAAPHRRSRLGARTVTALAAAGLIGGGLVGGYVVSNAATTSSNAASPSSSSTSANGTAPAHAGLPDSGTVTAVGSNSVTISGTTYTVTSNSDIDKNGESTLAKLAVGDKVTFSTVSGASTPTIDKLHAGNESLDMPSGAPPSGAAPNGQAPSGVPPSGTGAAPATSG